MSVIRFPKMAIMAGMSLLVIALPVLADELRGTVKAVDRVNSRMVVHFLLEMGMTASRKLKDLKTAGLSYVLFGLLAPNIFATLGILVAHTYSWATGTHFELGTYVLFSVLCGAASYIAVPAVQRLAIPEASPTLPLAASLGLTFSYNVTIGIPVYMEITKAVVRGFPVA